MLSFLDRKDRIATLKEFKSGNCLIILVYSVSHNLVLQNFTAIRNRHSISHFSHIKTGLINSWNLSLHHSFLQPLFFDQVTKNSTFITMCTTTSLTFAWQKAAACCTSAHLKPQYIRALTQPHNTQTITCSMYVHTQHTV